MAGTAAASGAAIAKAGGSQASEALTTEYDDWIEEAESFLCNLLKYDIVTNWASLNAVKKLILTEYVSSYSAVQAIKYDMSRYSTITNAEDMISVLTFRMKEIEKLLNKSDIQDFLGV